MSALTSIKKQFPQVIKIVEAKESIAIEVTERDCREGRKKDSTNCALAIACKRIHIAEACIIGVANTYLIAGDTATRYKTSSSVGREITTFDRHHDFAAGKNYVLGRIPPTGKLSKSRKEYLKRRSHKRNHGPGKKVVHRTQFIRKLSR